MALCWSISLCTRNAIAGFSVHDAALEAAKERFRPILMTTLAAIFGALPLAFASGVGAELRRPLGITGDSDEGARL